MSNNLITFSLTVFTGLIAVMNPIADTSFFLGLVGDRDVQTQKKIAKKACITAFAIIFLFVVLGKGIFGFFEITIPAFKITGGILLFFVGFEMLQAKKSAIQHQEASDADYGIAVSPLAIPILAGPGTIVTAMDKVTDGSFIHIWIVVAISAFVLFLNYIAFRYANLLVKKIGNNIIMVTGKIMGLILAIMGTDMIIQGIKISFKI